MEKSRFYRYVLTDVLEKNQLLYLDTLYFVVCLLDITTNIPDLLEIQILTYTESRIFLVLLENFPYYAPYAELYAAQTGESLKRSQRVLETARETGTWDTTLRATRNSISRLRVKVRQNFHIEIRSIIDTGLILVRSNT